jgi:ferritin
MLNKALQDAMNNQIQHELYSAYLYLSLSAYAESLNRRGFAHWLRVQAQEEVKHAMKFFDFIHDRGGRVILQAIDQPSAKFKSLHEVFQQALAHEQKISGLINKLYELAVAKKDYAAQALLQWFVTEQVEEEKSAAEIVEKLGFIGNQPSGLLMIDKELGERTAE